MKYTYRQIKNLFMQQSYLDSWEDYERSLNKANFIRWDYIILTASNEAQAEVYRSPGLNIGCRIIVYRQTPIMQFFRIRKVRE